MMSGCATVIFFHWLGYKINGWKMSAQLEESLRAVAKLGALLYLVIMFFTTWKMISGISGHPPGKYEAIMSLISGPYAKNFWYGEVGLGLAICREIVLAHGGDILAEPSELGGLALHLTFPLRPT